MASAALGTAFRMALLTDLREAEPGERHLFALLLDRPRHPGQYGRREAAQGERDEPGPAQETQLKLVPPSKAPAKAPATKAPVTTSRSTRTERTAAGRDHLLQPVVRIELEVEGEEVVVGYRRP